MKPGKLYAITQSPVLIWDLDYDIFSTRATLIDYLQAKDTICYIGEGEGGWDKVLTSRGIVGQTKNLIRVCIEIR